MCQPLDHGSNRLLCAVNSNHNQHAPPEIGFDHISQTQLTYPDSSAETLSQTSCCKNIESARCPYSSQQKRVSRFRTHQNVFPVLRGEVFVRRLGCKQVFLMSVITFSVGMSSSLELLPDPDCGLPRTRVSERELTHRRHRQKRSVAHETLPISSLQRGRISTVVLMVRSSSTFLGSGQELARSISRLF